MHIVHTTPRDRAQRLGAAPRRFLSSAQLASGCWFSQYVATFDAEDDVLIVGRFFLSQAEKSGLQLATPIILTSGPLSDKDAQAIERLLRERLPQDEVARLDATLRERLAAQVGHFSLGFVHPFDEELLSLH
ncbi:MAG TPA: hypothetical protein VEK14_04675 [Rhodomicrobium sp.]|nr:hypothetical protein [Rhodomicrobium sp.]